MNLIRILNKFRRELYKPLSKLCVIKKASVNYKGLKLNVPVFSGIGSGYLVTGDHWMSECLSVFLKKKNGMIIDVGVNIGLYLVNLRAIDSDRDYLGFEPNAFCNFYTQELIKLNGFRNARILPFALSDKSTVRTFHIGRIGDKTGSFHEYACINGVNHSFDVFTMKGEDLFEMINADQICAVKVDVEGAELEVLRGLMPIIQKCRPYIFCEIWHLPYHDHPTYEEKYKRLVNIDALLKEIDYVVLAVDKTDSSIVDQISSVDQFNIKQRRDYILVHNSESNMLKTELAKIQ